MTKVKNFISRYKRIIVVSGLLVLLIAVAILLFGNSSQSLTVNSPSTRSETEAKLIRILSEIDGVGRAEVMINEGQDGVEGVVIVCQGANSIMTRNDVINAVKVALKVDKNKIAVYAMN